MKVTSARVLHDVSQSIIRLQVIFLFVSNERDENSRFVWQDLTSVCAYHRLFFLSTGKIPLASVCRTETPQSRLLLQNYTER